MLDGIQVNVVAVSEVIALIADAMLSVRRVSFLDMPLSLFVEAAFGYTLGGGFAHARQVPGGTRVVSPGRPPFTRSVKGKPWEKPPLPDKPRRGDRRYPKFGVAPTGLEVFRGTHPQGSRPGLEILPPLPGLSCACSQDRSAHGAWAALL